MFEKQSLCRTHLIFGDDFPDHQMLGYFSLSFKEVQLQPCVSVTQAKKLKSQGSQRLVRSFLIGQLGKNSAVPNNPIDLQTILDEAFSKIESARREIGGKSVILECDDDPGLINHYEKHGFKFLQKDDHITMYAILD